MEQVAAAAGITKGFISRIERDVASPSVASLVAICDVVAVSLGSLFDQLDTGCVRAGERIPIAAQPTSNGLSDFLLSPPTQRRIQAILSEVAAGGGAGDDLYTVPSEVDFVHVLSGEINLKFPSETLRLRTGDSLTFSGTEPHTWRNASKSKPSRVLWILSPAP